MSRYHEDILKQPDQLINCLQFHTGEGRNTLKEAYRSLAIARHVYIVAIGASWNAGIAVQYALGNAGIHATLCDASEFYHYWQPAAGSTIMFLSRSGKSIEIVKSIEKCKAADATVIAITNDPGSPLGKAADIVLDTHVDFDHAISVNTYSSIILTGLLLSMCGNEASFYTDKMVTLENALRNVHQLIPAWEASIQRMTWSSDASYYFLARHFNLASAHEAALLWQEAAKYPATAMSTGTFRHGPQEIIEAGIRIVLWPGEGVTRQYDLQLAADLQHAGADVLLIGDLNKTDTDIPFIHIPQVPLDMGTLLNIIPIQLASEKFSALRGHSSDTFRYCELVVEREGGL